jgi:hypothetical protein
MQEAVTACSSRVPCLLRWPGVIRPGTVTNELMSPGNPSCCTRRAERTFSCTFRLRRDRCCDVYAVAVLVAAATRVAHVCAGARRSS